MSGTLSSYLGQVMTAQAQAAADAGNLKQGQNVVVNALAFSYVYFRLSPDTVRVGNGASSIRLAHLAMVDQETGLRAYLLTGQDRFLAPYRAGRGRVRRSELGCG